MRRPGEEFHLKPKDENKDPFYILRHQKSRLQLSCPQKKVSSAEEFLHEKVTDISPHQWHGDKSGKSYRAALHSLQYLLPVLIIRLIKPVGWRVGAHSDLLLLRWRRGDGQLRPWEREGHFYIDYITRWMNRCAIRTKKETLTKTNVEHRNKRVTGKEGRKTFYFIKYFKMEERYSQLL